MGMADPEVESAKEPYSCHFQFPDPISKVAGSRTTRYRLCKKRKRGSHTDSLANCDDIEDNSQAVPFDANDVEDNATTSSGQSSVEKGASCSVRVTTACDRADSEVLEGTQAEVGLSDEHGVPEEPEDVLNDLLPEDPEVLNDLIPEEPEADDDHNSLDAITDAMECDTPLYPDSLLTQSSSSLLIKQYSVRHNLTQEALADLLKLLRLHCPTPNSLPISLYSFQKHFHSLQIPLTLHYYCSSCLQHLPNCEMLRCPNVTCGKGLKTPRAISSFIEMPLEQQIVTLMERKLLITAATTYIIEWLYATLRIHEFKHNFPEYCRC